MSQPPALPLDSRHVIQQFARRNPLDAAQFLYGELAQRLIQRLHYIRLDPNDVLDAGCGNAHALAALQKRYPDSAYTGLDACAAMLGTARQRHLRPKGLLQRLRRQHSPMVEFIQADLAHTGLPPESIDLVWSNMALHWHPEPHRVFAEWRRIVRPGGLVLFSALGPGSFPQLRQALQEAQLNTATLPLVDMHDYGDLLLEHGFLDPVMDQETITLTYDSGAQLLADLRTLGGNPSVQRHAGLVGRQWHARLIQGLENQRQTDGKVCLTLEVAYGHAWRAASHRRDGETRISVSSIGRAPPRSD